MRVIDNYKFYYGTKIPFSEIPDYIHRFFSDQGLNSNRFMYYFEDLEHFRSSEKGIYPEPERAESIFATHGCERILKDCPELGNIRYYHGEYNNHISFLTNLDGDSFPEQKILPLMKKIHRRYGFFQTSLYYSNIDFFGETIPYEPTLESSLGCDVNSDKDPAFFDRFSYWSLMQSPNSGIEIYRCSLPTDNFISLSVDSLFDGNLRDTTPYYNALRAALPRMRSYHESVLRLTKEEKTIIDHNNRTAIPILEKCRQCFSEHIPAENKPTIRGELSGIAKAMRSIAESHGFTYRRAGNGEYKAAKQTTRNAVIYVELSFTQSPAPLANQGISWQGAYLNITFQGLGFKHLLYCDMYIPRNQDAVIARLNEVFSAVDLFERTLLHELDSCFECTPDWFVPSDYFEKEYGGYHY